MDWALEHLAKVIKRQYRGERVNKVEPKVFIVAETQPVWFSEQGFLALDDYIKHITKGEGWSGKEGEDYRGPEALVEIMGRSCYKSFGTELNPNITKVRESGLEYLKNIIKVGHGSVLEHSSVSFMFCNVSRVFTHELVRHRVGCAISQESLRFVRLEEIDAWAPTVITESEDAMLVFTKTVGACEKAYRVLTSILIKPDMPFSQKKIITSALRRIAPIGLATNIGWTANFRTLRHVLEMRTDPSAEEEIRKVFSIVGNILCQRYPSIFADYKCNFADGYWHYYTKNRKV